MSENRDRYGFFPVDINGNWYFGSAEYRNANMFEKLIIILGAGFLLGIVLIFYVCDPIIGWHEHHVRK